MSETALTRRVALMAGHGATLLLTAQQTLTEPDMRLGELRAFMIFSAAAAIGLVFGYLALLLPARWSAISEAFSAIVALALIAFWLWLLTTARFYL